MVADPARKRWLRGSLRTILLIWLSSILLIAGGLTFRAGVIKGIEAAFATGVFSLVRADYPSPVSADVEAEIRRRELELKATLEKQERDLKITGRLLLGGGVTAFLVALILSFIDRAAAS